MEGNYSTIIDFSDTYELKSLIKEPTCYKNPNQPSWLDLTLTSKPPNFQYSCVIEASLSDFNKMTVTVMKTFSEKLQPIVVKYRDYKYFENEIFKTDLLSILGKVNKEENENGFNNFLDARKRM